MEPRPQLGTICIMSHTYLYLILQLFIRFQLIFLLPLHYSMVINTHTHICLMKQTDMYEFAVHQRLCLCWHYLCLLIPLIRSILFWKLLESLVNLLFNMCSQSPICSLIVCAEGKLETAEIEMEKEVFRTIGISNIRTEYLHLKNKLQSLEDEFF